MPAPKPQPAPTAEQSAPPQASPAPAHEPVGVCPRCGGQVVELPKLFACQKKGCGFALWKADRFFTSKGKELTRELAAQLLKEGRVLLRDCLSAKTGKKYSAIVSLEDTGGKNVRYKMEFPSSQKRPGGAHPSQP